MLKALPLIAEDFRSQAKAAIYPLIISQLKYDGHIYLATELERVYAGSQKVNPGSHLVDLITGHLERVVEKKIKLVDSSSQYSSFDAPYDAWEDKENHKPRMKPSPTKIIYDLPIESRANIKCEKVRLISGSENPHLDILDSLQALTPQLPSGWSLKPEGDGNNGNRESPEGQSDSSVESPEPTIEEGEDPVFTEEQCKASAPSDAQSDVLPSNAVSAASSMPNMPHHNMPPTSMPPTSMPPTSMPPTSMPPTIMPPTIMPPTSMPPTSMPPTSIPLLRDDMVMPNTPYTSAILNYMPVHEMLKTMASPPMPDNNAPLTSNDDVPSMSNTHQGPSNNMPPMLNAILNNTLVHETYVQNNNVVSPPMHNTRNAPSMLNSSIPPMASTASSLVLRTDMPLNTPPAAGEMFPLPDNTAMPSLPKSTFSPAIPNIMPPWMTSDMFPQQNTAPPSSLFPQQAMTTCEGAPDGQGSFPTAPSVPTPMSCPSEGYSHNMPPSVAEQLKAFGLTVSIDQMLPNSVPMSFPTATIPQTNHTLPTEMPTSFPMSNFPTSFPQNEVTTMNSLPAALRNIGKPPNVPSSFPMAPDGFPTSLPPNFPTSLLKSGRPFDEAKTNTYYSTTPDPVSMSLSTLGGKSNLPFSEKSRLPSLLNQDAISVPGSRLPSLLNQDVTNVGTYGFTENSNVPSLLNQDSNLVSRMPSLLNQDNNAQTYNPDSGKIGMPYTTTIVTASAEVVPPSPEFKMTDDMADILSSMMMTTSPAGPVYQGPDPQSFPPVINNPSTIPSFPEPPQEIPSFQPYNLNGGNSNPKFETNNSTQPPSISYPPFDPSAPINSAYPPFDNNAPINTKYPPYDNTSARNSINEIPSPGSTVDTASTTNSPKTSPTSAFNMWFKNAPNNNQSPMVDQSPNPIAFNKQSTMINQSPMIPSSNQSPMISNNQSPRISNNQSPMTSNNQSPMTYISSVKSTPMTSPKNALHTSPTTTPLGPSELLRLGEFFNKQGNFSNNDWENLQLGQKTGAFSSVVGSGQSSNPTPFSNIGNTYSNTSSSSSTPAPSKHYFETDIVNQPESVESIWNSHVDKVGVIGQKKPVTKPSALDLNSDEKFIVIREIGIGGEINIVKATLQELIPRTGYFSFGDVLMSVFGKSVRYSVKYEGGNDVKPDKMRIGLMSYYTPLLMEVVGGSVTAVMNSKLKGNVLFPSEGYIIGYFGDKWRRFLDVKQTIQFICGADLVGYTPLDVAYGMFGDNWCRELRFRLNCENMLEMALDSRGNNMLLRGVTKTAIR